MVERGDQMRGDRVRGAGTTHGPAIDCDHPPPSDDVRAGLHERPDHPFQQVSINTRERASDRRLVGRRTPPDSSHIAVPVLAHAGRRPTHRLRRTSAHRPGPLLSPRQGSPAAGGAPRGEPEGQAPTRAEPTALAGPAVAPGAGVVGPDRIGGCCPRRGGERENFHPSPSGRTRHSRHTAHHRTKPQVTASFADFAEALGGVPGAINAIPGDGAASRAAERALLLEVEDRRTAARTPPLPGRCAIGPDVGGHSTQILRHGQFSDDADRWAER